MLLTEDLQVFFRRLNHTEVIFRMGFASGNYKILVPDFAGSNINPVLGDEYLIGADKFRYLTWCPLPSGRIWDKMSSCIQKAWSAFTSAETSAYWSVVVFTLE